MKVLNIGRYGDEYYTTLFVGSNNSPYVEHMLQLIKNKYSTDARVNNTQSNYIGSRSNREEIYAEIVLLLRANGYTEFEPKNIDIGD